MRSFGMRKSTIFILRNLFGIKNKKTKDATKVASFFTWGTRMPKKFIKKILYNPSHRAAVFLYVGGTFHFAYATFRFVTGIFYRQYRVDMMAVFYLLLALNRLFLIRALRKEDISARRYASRASARLLLFTLGVMVLLLLEILSGGKGREYPRYIAFVSGGYAIISATLAIYELVYARRLKSILLTASRTVSLTSALLSAFAFLRDLFFSFFSFLSAEIRFSVLLLLSGAILLFVFALAVWQLKAVKRLP